MCTKFWNLLLMSCLLALCLTTACSPVVQHHAYGKRYYEIIAQAKLLNKYYDKVMQSTGKRRAKYEQLFFDAYPSSFIRLRALYGNNDNEAPHAVLQEIIKDRDHELLFHNLKSIDKEVYYNKYIDLHVGGWWDEYFGEGGIYNKTYYDPAGMAPVMAKRGREEIMTVFRYMYDGPHPNLKQDSYDDLYKKLVKVDRELATLMRFAYEQLLSETHCDGH